MFSWGRTIGHREARQKAVRKDHEAIDTRLIPIACEIRVALENAAYDNQEYGHINGKKVFGVGSMLVESSNRGAMITVGFTNFNETNDYSRIIEIEIRLDDENRELLYFTDSGFSGSMALSSISEFKRYCCKIVRDYRHYT